MGDLTGFQPFNCWAVKGAAAGAGAVTGDKWVCGCGISAVRTGLSLGLGTMGWWNVTPSTGWCSSCVWWGKVGGGACSAYMPENIKLSWISCNSGKGAHKKIMINWKWKCETCLIRCKLTFIRLVNKANSREFTWHSSRIKISIL